MVFAGIVAWEVSRCDVGNSLGVDSNDLEGISVSMTRSEALQAYRPSSAEPLQAILAREPLGKIRCCTQFCLIQIRNLQKFSAPIGSFG
jgi:hypothetical protein